MVIRDTSTTIMDRYMGTRIMVDFTRIRGFNLFGDGMLDDRFYDWLHRVKEQQTNNEFGRGFRCAIELAIAHYEHCIEMELAR